MVSRLTFKIISESKVTYNKEIRGFQEKEKAYYLTVSVHGLTSKVLYLSDSLENIKVDDIVSELSPYKIYSLLRRNLSNYEIDIIKPYLDYSDCYKLDTGYELVKINKLTEEEIIEYNNSFKKELNKAKKKYGEHSLNLIYDWDTGKCDICLTDYTREGAKIPVIMGFEGDYINCEPISCETSYRIC